MKLSLIIFALCAFIFTSAQAQLPITRFTTTQGTPVIFYQAMEVPILDINVAFYAGSAYDHDHFGLSALTTELISQGNAHKTANEIANQFAETGAQFAANNDRDYLVLQVRTLNNDKALTQTVATLGEIIGQPDFPEEAFVQKKNQQLLQIKQSDESGDNIADRVFYQTLYGEHPYAHPIDGTTTSVSQMTLKDIKAFHKQYVVAQNAVIVLVGAIDEKKARAIANNLMNSIPQGKKSPAIPAAHALKKEINIEIPLATTQTVVRLGQLGISVHDKDYFPLLVGNYILGGGNLVSLLATELREKRGLTYGIYSQFGSLAAQGPFIINFSTQKAQAHLAEKLTRDTLYTFIEHGPTNNELKSAKQYLIGSFPLSIASNQSIAQLLLKMHILKLPDDYLDTYTQHIDAVSIEQIQQAFKQHIQPKKLINIQVGNT